MCNREKVIENLQKAFQKKQQADEELNIARELLSECSEKPFENLFGKKGMGGYMKEYIPHHRLDPSLDWPGYNFKKSKSLKNKKSSKKKKSVKKSLKNKKKSSKKNKSIKKKSSKNKKSIKK